jgi:hypothetical protein
MRALAAYVFCLVLAGAGAGALTGQSHFELPTPALGQNHYSIHNLRPAHRITLGGGAKVGILDRSFGLDSHPELYSGGHVFSERPPLEREQANNHRGYWMALALHEVAPDAEIYPLVLPSNEEKPLVEAIVEALDWAVEHDLDVVTYCGGDFPEADRENLDRAVERTVEAGVVVVFLGYSHPLNLLPGGFGSFRQAAERAPDLHIFSPDCSAMLTEEVVALIQADDDAIQRSRPFLGRPNAGSVTAGFVALMRSVDPVATPWKIKRALVESSRPMEYQGLSASRVPDAFRAVSSVAGLEST